MFFTATKDITGKDSLSEEMCLSKWIPAVKLTDTAMAGGVGFVHALGLRKMKMKSPHVGPTYHS